MQSKTILSRGQSLIYGSIIILHIGTNSITQKPVRVYMPMGCIHTAQILHIEPGVRLTDTFPASTWLRCIAPQAFTKLRWLVPRFGMPHELQQGPNKFTASSNSHRMAHSTSLGWFAMSRSANKEHKSTNGLEKPRSKCRRTTGILHWTENSWSFPRGKRSRQT